MIYKVSDNHHIMLQHQPHHHSTSLHQCSHITTPNPCPILPVNLTGTLESFSGCRLDFKFSVLLSLLPNFGYMATSHKIWLNSFGCL